MVHRCLGFLSVTAKLPCMYCGQYKFISAQSLNIPFSKLSQDSHATERAQIWEEVYQEFTTFGAYATYSTVTSTIVH